MIFSRIYVCTRTIQSTMLPVRLQTGKDRPAAGSEDEDLVRDGAQRGIVDVKVHGATRDGGVCVNYTTHATAPEDRTDSAHVVRIYSGYLNKRC